MSKHEEINYFLKKPRSMTKKSFIPKGLSTSASCARKFDLERLLELLNVTNDITLQLKVFSALSTYLMFSKGANIDIVIKCNAVYDKIHSVLSTGLPRKSTEALNFLSALLYIDAEDGATMKRALATYARNMTRVSGCLAAMCEMFTECMLYHDTWKALCQCLAVACSGCEINQSYCSHLVPVCVQKCSQMNIDILLVLQSLMLNHSRNNQLFLKCNGLNIFTRELLHYDKCLQLLTTIVQYSKTSATLLQKTNVLADLRDFLRLYGPYSQLGQKATIILNHINSSAKEKEPYGNTIVTETEMYENQSLIKMNPAKKSQLENDNANKENEFEETKVLIQNVMKEIFNWKQNELRNLKKAESKSIIDAVNISRRPSIAREKRNNCKRKQIGNKTNRLSEKRTSEVNKPMETTKRKTFQCNTARKLSFSFLQKDPIQMPKHKDRTKCSFKTHKNDTQKLNIDDTQMNNTTFYGIMSDMNKNEKQTTLQDFSPIFASTPKRISVNFTEATVNSNKTSDTQTKQNKYNYMKKKRQEAKRELQKKKDMKNRSLGARFFGAINESCTTFVKTVKNIFNKNKSSNSSRSLSSNHTANAIVKEKRPNTYSFINYMNKRDAVMTNRCIKNKIANCSEFSTETNSCNTCDDTEVLKHKLTKDEFLKQTVKKLKLGINLYGCDFKKISKTMWPRETYMTPLVLYNLYRKLLLK